MIGLISMPRVGKKSGAREREKRKKERKRRERKREKGEEKIISFRLDCIPCPSSARSSSIRYQSMNCPQQESTKHSHKNMPRFRMHVVMNLNSTYTYFLLSSAMILLASSCYKYHKNFHEIKIMISNGQLIFIYFVLSDQETD